MKTLPMAVVLATALAGTAPAGDCVIELVQIDSVPDKNAEVNICPCFAAGEVAMTIFDVPPGGTVTLSQILIFWKSFLGGASDSLEAALIVYDMNQEGPADPATFTELAVVKGPVLSDGFLNTFDVTPLALELPESRFGLGLEFMNPNESNPFLPSVVSDDDGHNNVGGVVRNWVLVDGVSWESSQMLGVSGDWVIRGEVEICEAVEPCPWDFDPPGGDGEVGISEFLILLGSWGTMPGGPPDFDGGGVGITDFLKLLGSWGPCP